MEDKQRAKTKRKENPSKSANILSKLTFSWTWPIFWNGYKRDITEDDLYAPLKSHESRFLGDRLEQIWIKEVETHPKPSFWRALFKAHGLQMVFYVMVTLFQEIIVKMMQPLLIGRLMSYYAPNQTSISKQEAYWYATGMVLIQFLNVVITHSYFFGLQHLGLKIRVGICSLLYRKALKLSKAAMINNTVGQMVNLMANDVNRFEFVIFMGQYLFITPIEVLVVVYLLYTTLHPSAMAGVALLLTIIPLQLYLGKLSAHYRRQTAIKTDRRVRLMNEVISGIQVIKMYAWEKPFAQLIELARKTEIHQIRAASYLRAITFSFMIFLNRTAVFLCVITYVLTGNLLTAEYVYVLTSYYSNLRQTLTMFLPRAITMIAETNVSVKRLQTFLSNEEVTEQDPETANHKNNDQKGSDVAVTKTRITMEDVCAKWSAESADYTLTNINFTAEQNQLVAIVGPIGSGKSTLLHILLKELDILKGYLDISGTISYAAQEPWLFAGSIRQNILFGQEFNEDRYKEVVKVCALERDFALFPYGDNTIVGERGVMLSGGQKARINLARAVYKDADIYLLDDPLSAVDAHVGKQLFEECISGYLKPKCVILITHQLQYLTDADKIYLLENGTITASGSYEELRNSGGEFVKLLEEDVESDEDDTNDLDGLKSKNLRKIKSQKSINEKAPQKTELPVEIKEHRTSGGLAKGVNSKYFKATGSYLSSLSVLILFVLSQLIGSGADLFVTFWVNTEQDRAAALIKQQTNFSLVDDLTNSSTTKNFADNLLNYTSTTITSIIIESSESANSFSLASFLTTENMMYFYSGIIGSLIIITLFRSLIFFKLAMKASQKLHNDMFNNIVRSTMRFYNTNPSGRILNRFSKDMGSLDETLPQSILDTMQVGLSAFAISFVLVSVSLWISIPTLILFVVFYYYKVIFLSTSRDLKRIEGTTRSPIFSHLTASLNGLSTIRAFKAQDILRKEFDHHQDLNSSAYYLFCGCTRGFGFFLDTNCIIYIALVIYSFLFIGTETYGGNVGLAITQCMNLTGMLQWGMRQWSELENQMTSVERIIEYTEIPTEPDEGKRQPPKNWPSEGNIEFKSVFMQYSEDEPFVLKNLTFSIKAGEKIGIVGRTGAGKSSLISAFFRLADIEGDIIIDNVNTKEISLSKLRSKISIIPQEPVLFSGTLRKNLDPFDEFQDSELWTALEEVNLKSVIAETPSGLLCKVSEGGSNFSVGQRQLFCLARALIRSNRILIMDEATANVDPQTDELIQNTIRKTFKDCTVLTIAHRLHTIMDSDKILVMDAGRAVEFDHPYKLLQDNKGIFYQLVQQTGRATAETLTKIAETNYGE